ncbi:MULTISPECIES: biotin transporter BioY [Actinoalloteichus]|uniref:Biotin transporter n=1 Tax=Actinoalloteichus caeruleus DSM 43889 TaxID=1120930 RepID=A0ABT1JIZ1_ACTCY|nr:biotin transporter BioY [Actinoalloteichus caeruleus]MCP2332143.1 biotin transport system substrate-specific component [Actinoalloteichus caeruleus DSM 43889]
MSVAASPTTTPRYRVLADVVPGALARDIVLVLAAAGLVGLTAQVVLPVPGSPVPITGQTFGVLLVGSALGWRRAAAAMGVYLAVGAMGVPWFQGGTAYLTGATVGYLLGMLLAGALVGALASRGGDRTVLRTVGTMALGNLVIYAVGVPGLMIAGGLSLGAALTVGVVPFLVGDALKTALAAGVLPGAWSLVNRGRKS